MNLKNGTADIAAAVKDSEEVEVDESGKNIRRKGAKPVPELQSTVTAANAAKKRDQKAAEKEEGKQEQG